MSRETLWGSENSLMSRRTMAFQPRKSSSPLLRRVCSFKLHLEVCVVLLCQHSAQLCLANALSGIRKSRSQFGPGMSRLRPVGPAKKNEAVGRLDPPQPQFHSQVLAMRTLPDTATIPPALLPGHSVLVALRATRR